MTNDQKERDAAIDVILKDMPWLHYDEVFPIWNASRKHRDLQIADELVELHLNASETNDFHQAIGDYIDGLEREQNEQ
jgi:hypothetical protein